MASTLKRSLAGISASEDGIEAAYLRLSCPLCGATSGSEFMTAPDRFHWRLERYRLARGGSCFGVWTLDPPGPHAIGAHYGADYHRLVAAAGETQASVRYKSHRRLVCSYKTEGMLLDIGCSSGGFLSTMKGRGWKLHGIEIEPSTAETARATTGAEVFVGDVADAPFANESFDVITCFDVLEHIYEPTGLLRRALAWLKPGGIFCTVLPNIDSWEARIFRSYWFGLELPRHLVHFSPKSLRFVMEAAGFTELHVAAGWSFAESSARYVFSGFLEGIGLTPEPLAKAKRPRLPWRAARKLIRLALISPFARIATAAGAGASIEAVFAKREPQRERDSGRVAVR